MKRILSSFCAVLVVCFCSASFVVAADATFTVDTYSAYVWRGITFNEGMVVQPSLDISKEGFGLNVWGNLDVGSYSETLNEGEFSEVDFTLSYGFTLDPVGISIGYIEYLFPEGGPGTREIYGSVESELYGIGLGFTIYYDFDEVEDYYYSLSIGYGFEISENLSVELSGAAGYAGKDASAGIESGFHDYTISVATSYSITEEIGISATIAYTDTFDKDVLPGQDVSFYGGIGVSYSF